MRPVTDRAEVAVDFPDKVYMGTFGHAASFAAAAAPDGVELKLVHCGMPKRTVSLHLHWYLFADVIDEIAAALEGRTGVVDEAHRAALAESLQRLAGALAVPSAPAAARDPGAEARG